jgi:hypothetical protein
VQQWNGKCFDDTSLSKLGYIWHMGHGGQPCPQSQVSQEWEEVDEDIDMDDGPRVETIKATPPGTTSMTIVHSTGVFTHNIFWCECCGSDPQQHVQLLNAGLFPASISRPRTAFTFEVLDHFLIDALECKTSAMSFFQKLRRLTNNASPDCVPVGHYFPQGPLFYSSFPQNRYRELMRTSRQFRDLMNRKRFGFGHDTKVQPGQGELALFCAACPQPGINMPLSWQDKYPRQVVCFLESPRRWPACKYTRKQAGRRIDTPNADLNW